MRKFFLLFDITASYLENIEMKLKYEKRNAKYAQMKVANFIIFTLFLYTIVCIAKNRTKGLSVKLYKIEYSR